MKRVLIGIVVGLFVGLVSMYYIMVYCPTVRMVDANTVTIEIFGQGNAYDVGVGE